MLDAHGSWGLLLNYNTCIVPFSCANYCTMRWKWSIRRSCGIWNKVKVTRRGQLARVMWRALGVKNATRWVKVASALRKQDGRRPKKAKKLKGETTLTRWPRQSKHKHSRHIAQGLHPLHLTWPPTKLLKSTGDLSAIIREMAKETQKPPAPEVNTPAKHEQ